MKDELIELVKVLPPIESGSVIVLRMDNPVTDVGKILKDGLEAFYGHNDFLVVVLGLRETMDVLPPQELSNWITSRQGYFGGKGGRYHEED